MSMLTVRGVVVSSLLLASMISAQEAPAWQSQLVREFEVAVPGREVEAHLRPGKVLDLKLQAYGATEKSGAVAFLRRIESTHPRVRIIGIEAVRTGAGHPVKLALRRVSFRANPGALAPVAGTGVVDALASISAGIKTAFAKVGVHPEVRIEIGEEGQALELTQATEFAVTESLQATLALARSLQARCERLEYEEGKQLVARLVGGAPQRNETLVNDLWKVCRGFQIHKFVKVSPVKGGARIDYLEKRGYRFLDLARVVKAVEGLGEGVRLHSADFGKRDLSPKSTIWRPRSMIFRAGSSRTSLVPWLEAMGTDREKHSGAWLSRMRIDTDRIAFDLTAENAELRQALVEAMKTWPGVASYESGSLSQKEGEWLRERNANLRLTR